MRMKQLRIKCLIQASLVCMLLCSPFKSALAGLFGSGSKATMPKGVILIYIDDIGYGDIDVLYPSDLETPNIDKFYHESVRFTDFHVGTTCAPSRAMLMTGRSVNASGVWHTVAGREILREDEQTMAEVFKANGWRTGIFGKWHLGDGYPFAPRFRGFEVSVVHLGGGLTQQPDYWENDYYSGVDRNGKPTKADVYMENGKPIEADRYCTDYWFERAKLFVKDCADKKKPFFCYLPTNAAHEPFNAPHGYKGGFDGMIENIDTNMKRLDEFLEAEGLKDDVLIIFTSDNGTTGSRLGGLRGQKSSLYEGGHNVPCFWRWKNGGIGGSADTARDIIPLTMVMDFLPTFMDMFGLERPKGGHPLHGISLKSMILDPDFVPVERTAIMDVQRLAELKKWRLTSVMKDEVRDGKITHKWRLIRGASNSRCDLYDFVVDRHQDNNIASEHKDVVDELVNFYEKWWPEISQGREVYPPFVINPEKEEEATLFSHSWIGADMAPWHQYHVYVAEKGTRTHAIRFDHSGRYRFELRRWPREDGGAIDGLSLTKPNKKTTVLPVKKVSLELESVGAMTNTIQSGDALSVFEMDVPAGPATKLKTALLDDEGNVLAGAYYVYIKPASSH